MTNEETQRADRSLKSRGSSRWWPPGLVGIGLAIGASVWTLIAGWDRGQPWPMVGLTLGVIATVIAARRVTRAWPLSIPCLVAMAPLIAVLVTRRSPILDGPLGYANASGSLYLLAVAGALTVVSSVTQPLLRRGLYLLIGAWLLGIVLVGADTSSLGAVAMVLAAVVLRRSSHVRGLLVAGGTLLVLTVGTTIVLAATYEVGGRASLAARVFDAALGQIRVVVWHDALEMIRSAPLLGVGPGRFSEISPAAMERADAQWAHSEFLQVAAETGVIGGVLLAGLVAWVFVLLWRREPGPQAVPTVVAVLAVMVNAGIDFVWHFPAVPLAAAAMVGWVLARPSPGSVQPFGSLTAVGRRAVVASVLLLVVLALPLAPSSVPVTVATDIQRVESPAGLDLTGRGGVVSVDPPISLYERLADTDEFAVELWLASATPEQSGPARILSMSEDTRHRNLTVGQEGDGLVARLRTTETDWNASASALEVGGIFATRDPVHVVVARDLTETRVYVDGTLRRRAPGPGGALDSWLHRYPLLLGNERTGERPWAGQLYLVGIYDRAFDRADVAELYRTRSAAEDPPVTSVRASALALYTFGEDGGASIRDRSELQAGGELTIPARFPAAANDSGRTFLEPYPPDPLGVVVHLGVFTSWALLLYPVVRGRRSGLASAAYLAGGGVLAALGASALRSLPELAPSASDGAAALAGILAGCILCELFSGARESEAEHSAPRPN
jgi:hypothetical protein